MLKWDEGYSIGVKSLDDQHKELLDRINKLLTSMKNNSGKTEVLNTLSFLETYVIKHFNDEEEIQKKYGYEGFDTQHREHELLKKEISNLRETIQNTGVSTLFVINLQQQIGKWWNNHILILDKELGVFLQGKL